MAARVGFDRAHRLGLDARHRAGVVVGFAIGLSTLARGVGITFISALFPIPKIALLPLMILWLGIGEEPKIATIALGVFFSTAISVYSGVDAVPRNLIRMAQSFNVPFHAIVRRVIWPGALPSILAGFRITASVALLLVVSAEMIGAQFGIGAFVLQAGNLMQTDQLLAGVVVLSLFGLAVGKADQLCWKRGCCTGGEASSGIKPASLRGHFFAAAFYGRFEHRRGLHALRRPLFLQPRVIARRRRRRRRHGLGRCQRRRAGKNNRHQCQTCPVHSLLPPTQVRSVLDGATLGQAALAEPINSQRKSAPASGPASPWPRARPAGSVPLSGATAAPPAHDARRWR